jgi:HK97 family phage major capsid protein
MDPRKILADLVSKQTALLAKAKSENRAFTADEKTQFDAWQVEVENCKATIAAQDQLDETNAQIAKPAGNAMPVIVITADHDNEKPFKNLAEQLLDVKVHARTGHASDKLLKVINASGATAGSGEDGGFAIQKDIGNPMMESAVKEDPFLSLVDSYPVSAKADRVSWNALDESSIASTIWGGILTYWASEAGTATATKPKMKEVEVKLQKILGFYYNTLEHEQDSTFNSAVVARGFQDSIRRTLAAAVVAGDGVGKPLGILSAPGIVSCTKESNQTADTIVWENISKMYHRALGVKSDFVWLCHPDLHEQFDFLKLIVGTGGVPVYLPSAMPGTVDTLRGRPVLDSDQCSALGDKGDIFFVNPKDYLLVYKGGVQQDASIHVAFLTAENCFRFMFRCNGIPKRSAALTIKNSSNQRSTIITLDAR